MLNVVFLFYLCLLHYFLFLSEFYSSESWASDSNPSLNYLGMIQLTSWILCSCLCKLIQSCIVLFYQSVVISTFFIQKI